MMWRQLYISFLLMVISLGCQSQPNVSRSTNEVQIFNPVMRQSFILGRAIDVQSTSIDSEGVQRVELWVNGQLVRADENPNPIPNASFVVSQAWEPRLPGWYTIEVKGYNVNQRLTESKPLSVQITPVPLDNPATPLATLIPAPTKTQASASSANDSLNTVTPIPPTPIGVQETSVALQLETPSPSPQAEQQAEPRSTPTPGEGEFYTAIPPQPVAFSETDIIIDNRSSGFQTTGTWHLGDGGQSYEGDCAWAPRGMDNNAYWIPTIPQSGMYELFAWWCGDPNHDQSTQSPFFIQHADGTQQLLVNYQENAGQWNSLGRYYFAQGNQGFVNVNGGFAGNVIADAVRLVYISAERQPSLLPTPSPTPSGNSGVVPSPYEQLAAGDLTRRMAVTGNTLYRYTPIVQVEDVTFDDCTAFPRVGCGGQVHGWLVEVRHEALHHQLTLIYRIAQNYQRMVLVDPPDNLREKQRVFAEGRNGGLEFQIDRYPSPDYSWHLFGQNQGQPFNKPLPTDVVSEIQRLTEQYNSVQFDIPAWNGWFRLYGWGPNTALSPDDQRRVEALGRRLGELVP